MSVKPEKPANEGWSRCVKCDKLILLKTKAETGGYCKRCAYGLGIRPTPEPLSTIEKVFQGIFWFLVVVTIGLLLTSHYWFAILMGFPFFLYSQIKDEIDNHFVSDAVEGDIFEQTKELGPLVSSFETLSRGVTWLGIGGAIVFAVVILRAELDSDASFLMLFVVSPVILFFSFLTTAIGKITRIAVYKDGIVCEQKPLFLPKYCYLAKWQKVWSWSLQRGDNSVPGFRTDSLSICLQGGRQIDIKGNKPKCGTIDTDALAAELNRLMSEKKRS